jgi:hypothetical protein
MATEQKKEAAKQKAIKGGMPSDVANNVFRMQMGSKEIDSPSTFPMKQAHTIRMSPMLQTENEEGLPQDIDSKTIAMPSGALATQTDVTSSFEIPGTTTTTTPESQGSYSKVFSGFEKNEKGQSINPINKNVYDNLEQFVQDAKEKPAASTTTTTPPTTGTKTKTTIDPKITPTQGLTALDQRKDARAGLVLARNIGKMEKKIARSQRKDKRRGGVDDDGKAKQQSAKTTALRNELLNLKNKSKARGEQSDQGFAGKQMYNIDVIGTPEQQQQLATSKKSAYNTRDMLAMPMRMMKFKGKKSGYKK